MNTTGLLLLIYLLCFLLPVSAKTVNKRSRGDGSKRKRSKKPARPTRDALMDWVHHLVPERDYNTTYWRKKFHSRSTQDFFFKYVEQLTKIFEKNRAIVNFASIGACDGISDPTIKYQFLKYPNWRGVFVEPMSNNFRDLEAFMDSHGVLDRSFLLRAAATEVCASPTIVVERPMYEELNTNNQTIPHWLRRQIGSILPAHRSKARPDWTTEEVRCVTASDILADWYANVTNAAAPAASSNKLNELQLVTKTAPRKLRPHILKIDVEGHDYQVLMSFLLDTVPTRELPLLVEFEAKSIAEKFPAAKARMEARGYVVSDFAQDGFALLKGETILQGFAQDGDVQDKRLKRRKGKRGKESEAEDADATADLYSYRSDDVRAPKIATTHDGYAEPE